MKFIEFLSAFSNLLYEVLKKFKNEKIDLQLPGIGQIVREKVKNVFEICSDDLDNYYVLDEIF